MKVKTKISAAIVCLAVGAAAVPALAHHSFAMFNADRKVVLKGTITQFQWSNPHIWIDMVVKDRNGKEVAWEIEGGSVNVLSRQGWKRNSIKVGDQAEITINPLKNGSPGGLLVNAVVEGRDLGGFSRSRP